MEAHLLKWMAEVKSKKTTTVPPVEPPTPFTPLVKRLEKFIENHSVECAHPQPLEFFRQGLRGRQPGNNAHAGELAAAMRKLGFSRKREWQAKDGIFRALWHPPK